METKYGYIDRQEWEFLKTFRKHSAFNGRDYHNEKLKIEWKVDMSKYIVGIDPLP